MSYQMIAIDLDDTLLNDDLAICEENKKAISEAIKSGKKVVISTGRMFKSALPFAQKLGLTLPLITYQGALVKEMKTGDVIWHKPVPLNLAREVLELGYQRGIHINAYLNDTLFVDSITDEAEGYAKLAGVEACPVGDLREFLQDNPTKLLFIGEPESLNELLIECRKHFGSKLHITKSKPHYLEFMHPEATKGKALEHLGSIFNISREETIAVGDSYNDLDMIKYAGLGVVMGNANEEVKHYADYITLSNNSAGVAHVIDQFMLEIKGK